MTDDPRVSDAAFSLGNTPGKSVSKRPSPNPSVSHDGGVILPDIVTANSATWTAASGVSVASASNYTSPHPSGRAKGLTLTKNPVSGTFGGARCTAIPANFRLSDQKIVGMDVLPGLISGSVTLRFSSDNFASKRVEYSWPLPGQCYNGEWNRLSARVLADTSGIDPNGAWTVTGGMSMDEVVNAVQISIATTANDAATLQADQVMAWKETPAKGVVMFGFDRYTHDSLPTLALPIAQRLGIVCYAAGDTNLVASKGAGWGRVKALKEAGWPIISQGPDHKDYVAAGASVLAADFPASRQVLDNVGLGNALDFFAYPFSSNNAATDAVLAAAGVKLASTGITWNAKPNEYSRLGFKPIGIARINIGGMTVAQVKILIDRAAIYGIILDLFCHGLVEGGDGTSPPADTLLYYANDWAAVIIYSLNGAHNGILEVTDPVTLYNQMGPR